MVKETEKELVEKFAKLMVAKLAKRKKRYKELGWRDKNYNTVRDLEDHLDSEIVEYYSAKGKKDRMGELIDIACFSFILHDRLDIE